VAGTGATGCCRQF